jgi:hypothetical protein
VRNDPELDLWMSDIKLRAISQIANLTREIEKAEPNTGRGRFGTPSGWASQ